MEHSEDTNLDIPLNAVRYMRLVVGRLLQDSHPVLTVRLRIFTCLQSTSGRQDYSRAETVLGVAAAGQSVMGMPSDISHVVHPDGRKTPAMFVEVSADCKVVLIVVRSLHMSPGKIGAQCAHAAVGLYKVIVTNRAPWLSAWESAGEKTVVLAVDTAPELEPLAEQAQAMSLATFTVADAGKTEVAPGSVTVLAIGGVSELVDQVSGKLRTY
ncbi:TPA: ubiquitin-specific protease ubp14, variant 3 [Trebouxia sp. C0004]